MAQFSDSWKVKKKKKGQKFCGTTPIPHGTKAQIAPRDKKYKKDREKFNKEKLLSLAFENNVIKESHKTL